MKQKAIGISAEDRKALINQLLPDLLNALKEASGVQQEIKKNNKKYIPDGKTYIPFKEYKKLSPEERAEHKRLYRLNHTPKNPQEIKELQESFEKSVAEQEIKNKTKEAIEFLKLQGYKFK